MKTFLIAAVSLLSLSPDAEAAALVLKKGDRICLVGNALGERLQHQNYWETRLYQRFPKLDLVVRNLCFPGDEPAFRLRSLNFGSPHDHLAHSKASVVMFFFGYGESFRGKHGLKKFQTDLDKLVRETSAKKYDGATPPRIVLVSPIAFEETENPHLPSADGRNKNLAMYSAAIKEIAKKHKVGFADVFTPTKRLFDTSKKGVQWTYAGAQLTAEGYKMFSEVLMTSIFGPPNNRPELNAALRKEIADKNFHWWHRYRAVNGYSIYGKRGAAGSDGTYRNRDVMERERAILDQMCANRDRRMWKIAQHQKVPAKCDDSNTLPFINPKTNVGVKNDPNRKRGKLGSLKYIPAAEQIKFFKLAPGYEINLVASEENFPELANPVSLNFDNKGRLWVSTMPSYPQWKPKTKLDDKLLILEDTNGDGRSDTCKVFAGGLHQPTGFELGNGGVYIAQQPDILFLKDTDGDDKADVRIRRLIGFDSADSHHGLAAFEWGPGGGLYFQEGTFKQSQTESPYGITRLGDAGVWRFEPKSARLDVHVSLAFANPWGHVFDRWGQNFIADASPGQNFWATPISGHVAYPDKHAGGARGGRLDWGGSKGKRPYPTFLKKRIRPSSGCEIISSRHFPPTAQGNFLVNNVIGELGILQHTVNDDGSGFGGKEVQPLVMCTHGNFRPVDLQFGPDGALYIVDWHNALIGHLQHNLREPNRDHSHGRIWRITYKGRPLVKPPRIAGEPVAKLLELLKEPENRTRYRVRRELAARKSEVVLAALAKWTASLDQTHKDFEHDRLEALWMYQTHDSVNPTLLSAVLRSRDHRARAAAVRVLSYWRTRVDGHFDLLKRAIADKHPRVRLEAVRACSFFPKAKSLEIALDALNHPMDTFLEYTLDETMRALTTAIVGQMHDQHHHHGETHQPPPLVFLNKSPKIIAFQLERLPASRLVHIKRTPQKKFLPVYQAILTRPGLSRQDREQALAGITTINKSQPVAELLAAIGTLNGNDADQQRVIDQLASALVKQPAEALAAHQKSLQKSAANDNGSLRAASYAGLIAAGKASDAWNLATASARGRQDFLASLRFAPAKTRGPLRERVLECLASRQPVAVRRAAIDALAHLPTKRQDNFHLAAGFVSKGQFRNSAVATMLRIPKQHRPKEDAAAVVKSLTSFAEATPARRRTTPRFLDAMHLVDELLPLLAVAESRKYRARLREVVVRVVRITTVHEEMRYDKPHFAVEAGRPVQIVLRNDDLMPHNLLITAPRKLREVAGLAAGMPATADRQGRQYVPKSKLVLFATKAVEPHKQTVLTFTAPKTPGEYPYVCTFPNHWMRMYGVMVVVKDLEEYERDPKPPADPLGITRKLVKRWSMEDFPQDLTKLLANRNSEIGARIYKQATCSRCHKLAGEGGAVGPDLSATFARKNITSHSVLREIIDPSHRIDEKYALYNIRTARGGIVSGIITKQDGDSITLITNPEKPTPEVIDREDISAMRKSSTSMMPKGLMDRFTKDEIFELIAYIKARQKKP